MGEKKLQRKYMTYKELQEEFVDWSVDTIKRRIQKEGFPAIADGNSYLFDRRDVELYFTKRKIQN